MRKSILAWQLATLLLLGLIAALATLLVADRSYEEMQQVELVQIADAVARHEINDDDGSQPGDFVSQVWDAHGHLDYASHEPAFPRPESVGPIEFNQNGEHWVGYAALYDGQMVLVAREGGTQRALLARVAGPVLLLVLLCTGALLLALRYQVRKVLQPLDALRADLAQRNAASFAPVALDPMPAELHAPVQALNNLIAQLDQLVTSQRHFTADAAHELRTPVTAIDLYAQLAIGAWQTGDTLVVRTHLDDIRHSGQRASTMIEQLLTLARLDGELTPQHLPVKVDALARAAVADLSVQAESRNIDLGIATQAPLQHLGDPHEWRLLLDNLIGNALRYTPPGGRVDLYLDRDHDSARLRIEDTGPGIPEQEHETVFERFHRVTGADGAATPGSGLGLAIVRRVAQRHRLRVSLANRAGGGLVVSVTWTIDPDA